MSKIHSSHFPYLFFIVLVICLWLILLRAPFLYAQGNYVPLAPIDVEGSEFTSPTYTYPGDTRADKTCTAPTCFPRYLKTIYNVGIALAGFFAVFSIVRGGFELLFTDSILGHTEAKGIILRAIGGLLVVYTSYILMNTINPQLARDLSLSFKTLPPPTAMFGNLPPNIPPETIQFLDTMLKNVNSTQTRASNLKTAADLVQTKLENGDYATVGEGEKLVEQYKQLKTAEVRVRDYEQTINKLNLDRTNMNKCILGTGPCQRTSGLGTGITAGILSRSPAEKAADLATAQTILESSRSYVNTEVEKLNAAGLTAQADDLKRRLEISTQMLNFSQQCPNSTVFQAKWKQGDPCP